MADLVGLGKKGDEPQTPPRASLLLPIRWAPGRRKGMRLKST
jgi:hypothetical protein